MSTGSRIRKEGKTQRWAVESFIITFIILIIIIIMSSWIWILALDEDYRTTGLLEIWSRVSV
jgi:hypothetical protein